MHELTKKIWNLVMTGCPRVDYFDQEIRKWLEKKAMELYKQRDCNKEVISFGVAMYKEILGLDEKEECKCLDQIAKFLIVFKDDTGYVGDREHYEKEFRKIEYCPHCGAKRL